MHHHTTISTAWTPPGESVATRTISRRSKGSGRAIVVGGHRRRQIFCESLLEHKAAVVLLARRDVIDLWEQPQAAIYVDENGRQRQHTFDFLVQLRDKRRIAIAVRPEHRAAPLRQIVAAIASQAPDYADGFKVVTDTHLSRDRVHNAETILMARAGGDPAADDRMREIARSLHGASTIGMLAEASGLGGEGYRTVVRLIDSGELQLVSGVTRIGVKALVERVQMRQA